MTIAPLALVDTIGFPPMPILEHDVPHRAMMEIAQRTEIRL